MYNKLEDIPIRSEIRGILQNYVNQVKNLNPDIISIILFGSQARGDSTIRSDIDLAIVMKDGAIIGPRERGEIHAISDYIDTPIEINLFFTTEKALDDAVGIFDTNKYIREEGVVIWQP